MWGYLAQDFPEVGCEQAFFCNLLSECLWGVDIAHKISYNEFVKCEEREQ